MTNDFEIRGRVAVIYLTSKTVTRECLIDASDLDRVREFPGRWFAMWDNESETFYVVGHKRGHKSYLLHRWLLGPDSGMEVDHSNHYGLDNRRGELKVCTRSENAFNRKGPRKNSASKIRGVYWNAKTGKWRVTIRVNGKRKDLRGGWPTPEEAGAARDEYLRGTAKGTEAA